jgi:hypothetical protein
MDLYLHLPHMPYMRSTGRILPVCLTPYVSNLQDCKHHVTKLHQFHLSTIIPSKINLKLAPQIHLSFPHCAVAYLWRYMNPFTWKMAAYPSAVRDEKHNLETNYSEYQSALNYTH